MVASGAPLPPHHRGGVVGIHSVAPCVNELERRAQSRFSVPVLRARSAAGSLKREGSIMGSGAGAEPSPEVLLPRCRERRVRAPPAASPR